MYSEPKEVMKFPAIGGHSVVYSTTTSDGQNLILIKHFHSSRPNFHVSGCSVSVFDTAKSDGMTYCWGAGKNIFSSPRLQNEPSVADIMAMLYDLGIISAITITFRIPAEKIQKCKCGWETPYPIEVSSEPFVCKQCQYFQ